MEPNKTTRTRNIVAQWVHLPAEKEIDQLIRVVAYAYECKDEISTKIACYEGRGPPSVAAPRRARYLPLRSISYGAAIALELAPVFVTGKTRTAIV